MTTMTKVEDGLEYGTLTNGRRYCVGITWTAGADAVPVAGMTLTGGRPETARNGGQAVEVVRFKQKVKGQSACCTYAARPDLAALVERYNQEEASERAHQAEEQAAYQARQRDAAAPLLAAMRAEAEALAARIPDGSVRVTVTQTGSADGDPILCYEAEGVPLGWQDVEIIGTAAAIHPGALAAFETVRVACIGRGRLEEIRTARSVARAASALASQERREELARPVPPAARDAYARYGGSDERAWDAGDEDAWGLIRAWGDHIEAQGLPSTARAAGRPPADDEAALIRAMIGEDA